MNLGDTYFGSPISGKQTGWERNGRTNENLPIGFKGKQKPSNWLQPKQLMLMPVRVAIAMQEDGWILRNDIIWAKPNPMPSSVKDRLNNTYEHIFHFVKSKKYYYNLDAIREKHKEISIKRQDYGWHGKLCDGHKMARIKDSENMNCCNPLGKNPGDVLRTEREDKPNIKGLSRCPNDWIPTKGKNPGDVFKGKYTKADNQQIDPRYKTGSGPMSWASFKERNPCTTHPKGRNPGDIFEITTQPFPESHFAVYPIKLCEKPIKASVPDDGIVLDPFAGAGTTFVALKKYKPNAKWIGFEISEEYIRIANLRLGINIKPEQTKKMGFEPLQSFIN